MEIEKHTEIGVTLKNKPGELARVASELGEGNVNILGFSAQTQGNKGPLRLITDNPTKAKKTLTGMGLEPTTQDVVVAKIPNKPGELGKVSQRLADSGINIESVYPTFGEGGRSARIAFGTDDVASTRKALQG